MSGANALARTGESAVRIGVLGASAIAREAMAPAFMREPGLSVQAVASRNVDRARSLASRLGAMRCGDGFEWVLADREIDAVYISLPPALHAHWALRALEAGKHVLCEKPIALESGDVVKLRECARARGRVMREADMWRHHPQIARLRDLLCADALGPVLSLDAEFAFELDKDDRFRLSRCLGGGVLSDLGPYCLGAAVEFCAGDLKINNARFSWSGEDDDAVETSVEATFAGSGGLKARIFCSFVDAPRQVLVVRGAEEIAALNQPWAPGIDSVPAQACLTRNAQEDRFDDFDPYAAMLVDFVDSIRSGAVNDRALDLCERRVKLSADLLLCGQAARAAR